MSLPVRCRRFRVTARNVPQSQVVVAAQDQIADYPVGQLQVGGPVAAALNRRDGRQHLRPRFSKTPASKVPNFFRLPNDGMQPSPPSGNAEGRSATPSRSARSAS